LRQEAAIRVGYARVSSTSQSLDVQRQALLDAGCEKVFEEKVSGTSTNGREELQRALEFVRKGDELTVTRLCRLARSVGDLHKIVEALAAKDVAFRCLNQPGVDTDSSTGRLMLNILGAVAAFENDIRRERQMEGVQRAKERGVYKGRKRSVPVDKVRELRREGVSPSEIARTLKIGRASVYRALST
jgi:DNA invertase Pin-like site-specific DNA recombinase